MRQLYEAAEDAWLSEEVKGLLDMRVKAWVQGVACKLVRWAAVACLHCMHVHDCGCCACVQLLDSGAMAQA